MTYICLVQGRPFCICRWIWILLFLFFVETLSSLLLFWMCPTKSCFGANPSRALTVHSFPKLYFGVKYEDFLKKSIKNFFGVKHEHFWHLGTFLSPQMVKGRENVNHEHFLIFRDVSFSTNGRGKRTYQSKWKAQLHKPIDSTRKPGSSSCWGTRSTGCTPSISTFVSTATNRVPTTSTDALSAPSEHSVRATTTLQWLRVRMRL